ncbi:retrovirus-related pol polyprotein from transposon TNT 1-94 [Tanacetum coccineum]
MTESPLVDSGLSVLVFSPGDDPIACLNKAMAFLTVEASSRFDETKEQKNETKGSKSSLKNFTRCRRNIKILEDFLKKIKITEDIPYCIGKGMAVRLCEHVEIGGRQVCVTCFIESAAAYEGHLEYKVFISRRIRDDQGRQGQSYSGTGYKSNATSYRGNNASGQARVVKCYNYKGKGHMARQCTQPKRPRNVAWYKDKAMLAEAQEAGHNLDEEKLAFLADPGILDGQAIQTIIPNNAAFQTKDLDTYDSDCDDVSNAKADFEQTPVVDVTDNEITSTTRFNDLILTAELERYKERVKTFEQHLNIDLSSREKMIDSQMDDMIKEKLALKEQVDSLEQNLAKQIKEKESLLQTFTVFKNESKEKKYMENEIDLEKKIKELDNIIFKVGQSAQTVHMLTKPQVFYDNAHKQALGYKNPFYLKKDQRIKPTLYDGIVISDKHVAMPVIDDEETLILEEESRSKMYEKEKDPKAIKQKISHKPIDYVKLNQLSKDFRKRFVPKQELSVEQAFWYHMSNPSTESSDASLVKMEAPK